MADNDTLTTGAPNGADNGPELGLIAQYVKDMSFENPNAPAVYQVQGQPEIDVQFNISTNTVGEGVYEVATRIEVKAKVSGMTAFQVELVYAGLFGARNVPEDALQPFLYAQAPQLLFPFARRVVADAVRDGNFPPLLLDPIDFGTLYAQQAGQAEALATAEPAGEA